MFKKNLYEILDDNSVPLKLLHTFHFIHYFSFSFVEWEDLHTLEADFVKNIYLSNGIKTAYGYLNDTKNTFKIEN